MSRFFVYTFFLIFCVACVTPKVHNTLLEEHSLAQEQLIDKEKESLSLEKKNQELANSIDALKTRNVILSNDSIRNGRAVTLLQEKYNELDEAYDLLVNKNSRYISEKAKETKELLKELELAKAELFEREDKLIKMSDSLSNSLSNKEEELLKAQKELNSRVKRVTELEAIIKRKDSTVTNLKARISQALAGLEGEGLTIEKRNGKLYLSLEEDLLFASGKYELNTSGIDAIKKLANVLSSQDGLEILVEGHTDSIPYSSGQLKDNWDLSVMRATSVVKALIQNNDLSATQLTAAGRGEYLPIDSNSSSEGRAANRRIEMILSPRLDNIFKLLDN
ncbi:MAG: OmpA family protein [Bacteroidota bacterium]|nr:OmpA family protein [Bacteroidota bacterium]